MSTIVAISTPPGNGGIGIVRMSGKEAFNIIEKIFVPKNKSEIKGYSIKYGNIIDDKAVQDQVGYGKYDIVVANILADVLVPLTPVIVNQMKTGALYITSGIIDMKETEVRQAVEAAGLEIVEVTYQGEWVSVTARKGC